MKKTEITSLQIIEKAATNGADYFYMIFDNNKSWESNDRIFFGFRSKLNEESWNLLKNNYKNLKEIEIEYELSTTQEGKERNNAIKITNYSL